jgi:hypothetical protein
MKTKNLLLIFVLAWISVLTVNAQVQPTNGGFENWVPIGLYENPDGWSSFNNFYSYGIPEMSFKDTSAHSGTYALRLISDTATVPPPFGTNILDTLAGFVFIGGSDFSNPGISYTDRPLSMQAFVKGTIVPGGNVILMATLRKWNTSTHVRDQVGQAMYFMTSSITNYTQISVPFNYSLPSIPDTLEIKIMAGDVGPGGIIMPGNEFFVDDISFTFPVGINEQSNDNRSINISPNPTPGKFAINSFEKIDAIKVYNILGENVYSINNLKQQTSNEIDLSGFQKGIYFVKIQSGEKLFTKRIVVQ